MRQLCIVGSFAAALAAGVLRADLNVLDWVDPFIGTGGNGHTTPAAAYPFGMVQPGPDTGHGGWSRCSGYQYSDGKIERFSQNHLSGTGCSEFTDLGFMPASGGFDEFVKRGFSCEYDKASEKASPGYYGVTLKDGVKVEATCTDRVALWRFTYPKDRPAWLLFDPSWSFRTVKKLEMAEMANRRVSGHIDRAGWPGHDLYFAWEISAEPVAVRAAQHVGDAKIPQLVYDLDVSQDGVVYLKVALSRTSAEGARRNIDAEVPGWDFDGVLAANRDAWRTLLGRVKAKGSPNQLKGFYTALYHLCFQPNLVSDVGEDVEYSTFSCWDTYRAAGPLYTILTPEYVPAFVNSMLKHYDRNGFLPVWALWGKDNQCMIGVHSVPMVVDAYLKGFGEPGRGNWCQIDWEKAWKCVKTTLTENRNRGKARYELIEKYGYYPCDIIKDESVSRLLEGCYDDACAARFAKALGKSDDAAYFLNRSRNWTNCFDRATGFIRGKDSKGALREPFDPCKVSHISGCDYTEGNAFHWNWHVMQEPDLLVGLLGGKDAAVNRLEGLFSADSSKSAGKVLDVTGLIGQYCHGNEPSHHDIYFFTLLGRRDLAAKYIGEVMETQYQATPTGLCGNDDCGQMSAWYIFACLGFYPFDPCGGEYVLGEAQLPSAIIDVGGGRTFRVVSEAPGSASRFVELNGSKHGGAEISHADIMEGGTLRFVGGKAFATTPYVVEEPGSAKLVFDTSNAPDLRQWTEEKFAPAMSEWVVRLTDIMESDGWKPPKEILFQFVIEPLRSDSNAPAWASARERRVRLRTDWFRKNLDGEALGATIHELVHIMQNYWTKGHNKDNCPGWASEGYADYIRWFLFEPESDGCGYVRKNIKKYHYNDSYRVTAHFFGFVEGRYPGTMKKLNAAMRDHTFDNGKFWQSATGKAVEELEKEWSIQSQQL